MATETHATETVTDRPTLPFGRWFDWLVGLALALVGLLTAGGGWLLYTAFDRATVEEWVEEGTVESEGLTEPELVDAILAMAEWGGLGLLATGALFVVLGVAFVAVQTRVRGDPTAATPGWAFALVGALVTSVTSFVPFSPLIGGGAAAYMQEGSRRAGAGVGALSGAIGAAPVIVGVGFLVVGLVTGLPAEVGGLVGALVVGSVAFSAVYLVGLSAVGGYLGARFAEDDDSSI